jgi:hypothetical protein
MSQAVPGLPSRRTVVGSTGALAIVCTLVIVAAAPQLSRPGYSPDEEFTVFAVRGIDATGLPLLPSRWLYDRGVAYSYASWAVGSVAGAELPVYRGLALVSAVAALVLVYATVARIGSAVAAVIALLLVATSIPFWAVATSGRFYAPFLALYSSVLFVLGTRTLGTHPLAPLGTLGTLGTLTVLAFLCRLTHELAFTLVVVPALCFVLSSRGSRANWVRPGLAIVAGLGVAQAGLFALHYLAPSSGDTMIRRFFLWQVVNLFEAPSDRQFGLALIALVVAWLVAPRRSRLSLVSALCVAAFVLSWSLASEAQVSPFTTVLVASVLQEGSRYPLDMFWHIVRSMPVTITLALALLLARLAGAGGEWRPIERAAHLLWIGWVLWFGVIDSGITINYLLMPITFVLMAVAVDLAAILTHNIEARSVAGRTVWVTTCALVIAGVIADQWRGEGSIGDRLESTRPTINVDGIDEIRAGLGPGDRVACTDELGCLMLVGRIDAWLALDDFLRERFVVRNPDGQLVGVYTGRPAVFRPADLFDLKPAGRTIVVDVFKDLPVGNTRNWLPRALERDGVDVLPLLETPQARVVQISAPIHNASRKKVQSSKVDSSQLQLKSFSSVSSFSFQ